MPRQRKASLRRHLPCGGPGADGVDELALPPAADGLVELSRGPMRLKARIDGVNLSLGQSRGQRRDRFTGLGLIGSPGGRPGRPAVKAAGTIVDSACGYWG